MPIQDADIPDLQCPLDQDEDENIFHYPTEKVKQFDIALIQDAVCSHEYSK
jgi:hypothetical protein